MFAFAGPIVAVLGRLTGTLPPDYGIPLLRWIEFGAVSGAAFATALVLAERRHTIRSVSPGRFGLWGFLPGP
jgi:hypothetical protein